jgi:hypothetical protein
MFAAALRPRPWRVRQDGHRHARVDKLSPASRNPQAEHVFVLGYQRPVTIRRRRARWRLYSSWRRNSPRPQPEMARASRRRQTPATPRAAPDSSLA